MAVLTRERILDAALAQMVAEGPRHFSASRLARRLGVVKSALHHHFPGGKTELVDAVFGRFEQEVLDASAQAAQAAGSTRERLEGVVLASARHTLRLAHLYGVTEDAAGEIDDHLSERRRAFLARQRELIVAILAAGAARGEVRQVNPELVAAALQGALQSVVRVFAPRPEQDPEEALRGLVDEVLDGIGRR